MEGGGDGEVEGGGNGEVEGGGGDGEVEGGGDGEVEGGGGDQPNRQNTGFFAGIPGKTRVYLENTLRPPGYRADFLNFASDFAPVPRPALRLRETREFPEC